MWHIVFLKQIDRLARMVIPIIPKPPRRDANSLLSGNARILMVRPGGMGDAVLLLPVILALHRSYPEAKIDILAERRNNEVFFLGDAVRNVYCYDIPRQLWSVMRSSFDVVIDSEQWHRLSAIIARMTGAPMLIGFATNDRARMFTHPVVYSHDDHEYTSFTRLLGPLSASGDALLTAPFVQVADRHLATADRLLPRSAIGHIIALFPGGSIRERRWGTARFHETARDLASRGFSIVVVGGREDVTAGGEIVNGILGGLNLCGRLSLGETAAVLKRSALLITGDSGIMHLGYAVGTKVLALFGPGIEKKWAPRSPRVAILNKHLPCSPCTKFGYTPKCPRDTACMKGISAEDVINSAIALLDKV